MTTINTINFETKTRITTLEDELYAIIRDTTKGITKRYHAICAEIFSLLGGEEELKRLENKAFKLKRSWTDEYFEIIKQIDLLKHYKDLM